MILNDLFESRMSDLNMQYQDYKDMSSGGFYSRYKMSKDQWAGKHWSLIKGSQTVHEGAMKDLHTELAEKYRELAPKVEKYKDSFLAGQLYDALEAIAIEHGAELELKRMMTGARNRAHMDYDTNPGGFQNWFWYLPFADEDITEESQDDRNARIIAGEIEDAAKQGNEQLVKQKIKELIGVGYTLNKNGKLQRMGMYEAELEETFTRPETAREQQVQLMARTYAELYWGDRSITARASTAREIFNAVMSGELDTATLKMEIRALEQEQDISEEQDACYHKVKSRYKVWPSAYASGALVQCRKKGAANWGNKSKK